MNPIEAIDSHIRHLTQGQNKDGGWGHEIELPSSAMNTGEVVTAILDGPVSGAHAAAVNKAQAFILAGQADDGGWLSRGATKAEMSHTLPTAWSVQAISRFAAADAAVDAALVKAAARLSALQQASGAWIEYHEGAESVTATCHALLALETFARKAPKAPAVSAAINSGIAWLGSVHSEGRLAFVKGGAQSRMAAAVLGAYTSQTLAGASFDVKALKEIEEHVLKAARAIEPGMFEYSVETQELRTFQFQYQHCTIPILVRFLLGANASVSVLWPFLRHFWRLQEPGNGGSADLGGRRTTWATAQWILTARHLAKAAGERTELGHELTRIAAPERALIMKGGGVKGLALAGAIVELEEKGVRFDVIAGTSAGAIAAVLLASGYTGLELEDHLRKLNFKVFLDGTLRKVFNVFARHGLHSGDPIRAWVKMMIGAKIMRADSVRMRHLGRRAIIFATNTDETITFDSHGEYRDTLAEFAVRCSMSIPLYFVAQEHDGKRIYDGGLRHNFPVAKFRQMEPDLDFVGLYLEAPPPATGLRWLLDIFDSLLAQDEKELVQEHADKMVRINPYPVKTTQFSLTETEKDLLVWKGRAAARAFLKREGLATDAEVREAEKTANEYYAAAIAARAAQHRKRLVLLGAVAVAAGLLFFLYGGRIAHFIWGLIAR